MLGLRLGLTGNVGSEFLGGHVATLSIVGELFLSDGPYGKVVCLWQADHESAHGGMGLHHGGGGEGHPDALETNQFIEDEVDGDVGQAWVAHCGSDALKLLLMQFCWCQLLVGCIAPDVFPEFLV